MDAVVYVTTNLFNSLRYVWSNIEPAEQEAGLTGFLLYYLKLQLIVSFLVFSIIGIYRMFGGDTPKETPIRKLASNANVKDNKSGIKTQDKNEGNKVKTSSGLTNFGAEKKTPIRKRAKCPSDLNVKYVKAGIKTLGDKIKTSDSSDSSDLTNFGAEKKTPIRKRAKCPSDLNVKYVKAGIKTLGDKIKTSDSSDSSDLTNFGAEKKTPIRKRAKCPSDLNVKYVKAGIKTLGDKIKTSDSSDSSDLTNFGVEKKSPTRKCASDTNVKYIKEGTLHKNEGEKMKTSSNLTAHIKPFLQEIGPLPDEINTEDKDERAKIPSAEEQLFEKTVITSSDDEGSISLEDLISIEAIRENADKSPRYDPHAISVISQASEEIIRFRKLLKIVKRKWEVESSKQKQQKTKKTHRKAKAHKFDKRAPSVKLAEVKASKSTGHETYDKPQDERVPPKERKSL